MSDILNDIQKYTPSDVFRTAFKYMDGTDDSEGGLGAGLPHGINQVCICCKGGSTRIEDGDRKTIGHVSKIRDAVDLKPWVDFYKKSEFQAYKCHSCGYQWSWYRDKADK